MYSEWEKLMERGEEEEYVFKAGKGKKEKDRDICLYKDIYRSRCDESRHVDVIIPDGTVK